MLMKREPVIDYPDSDGEPMADNTVQFDWIGLLSSNLKALFADREDVFASGDQLWYPVQGRPDLRVAPDVYVVFGRPKGDRGSWKQWEEEGVPLTVVFEILSPGNTLEKMIDKFGFYDEHGVEEYYSYDPDTNHFIPYVRASATLVARPCPGGRFTSPRLGIHFDLTGEGMIVTYPDGRPFLTLAEEQRARADAQRRADEAERRADEAEGLAAEMQRRADQAERAAARAEQRLERLTYLAGRIASGQATADEATEFQRLLARAPA